MDHCSIWVFCTSIFSALLMMSSLYGFSSPLSSSNLFSCFSCSTSCCTVSAFMDSPVSTFLYICLVWSLVKYWPTVGQLSSLGLPVLKSNDKKFKGLLLSSSELCLEESLHSCSSIFNMCCRCSKSLSSLEFGQSLAKWSYSLHS